MKKGEAAQYDPIIFLNTPVKKTEDDVIGISSAVGAIVQAADKGAKMIGVIADYGAGKSTLTELLGKEKRKTRIPRKRFSKSITINMWDALLKEPTPSEHSISTLTKSFLFQLASGISQGTAKYINRKLNKNYGIISFSVSSGSFWFFAIAAAVMYIIYSALSSPEITELATAIAAIFPSITDNTVAWLPSAIKYGAVVFALIGAVSLIFGLRKAGVAYSHWKAQGAREPEVNDLFEAYVYLYNKLLGHRSQKLIIIEDLDRINDKTLVVDFLKEVYRFSNLPKEKKRKGPVILVSVKPESILSQTKNSGELTAGRDSNGVYSKIFDYTVALKPIHYVDYGEVVLSIIGKDGSTSREEFNKILGASDQIKGDLLPTSFSWIISGHNLTIRQLKDRLNSAVALLVTLKNKDYKNQPSISFSSCAAVTYLEMQYPQSYPQIVQCEDEFSTLVQEACKVRNQSNAKDRLQRMSEQVEMFFKKEGVKNRVANIHEDMASLKKDLAKMLEQGDISDDFRMYFYSFPKGCYIKNGDERAVSNLLLYPLVYPSDNELDEKIKRIVDNEKEKTIRDVLAQIGTSDQVKFPEIIVQNEYLFLNSFEIEPNKVLSTVRSLTPWKADVADNSCGVLKQLSKYSKGEMKQFWDEYCNWVLQELSKLSTSEIVAIRKCLLPVFEDDVMILAPLFLSSEKKAPIITYDELLLVPHADEALSLVNRELIKRDNFEYIAKYINREKLGEQAYAQAYQIFKLAKETIPSSIIWKDIIHFLQLNQTVDVDLFNFAISEASAEKATIGEYINSLRPVQIPQEYCEAINEAIIDVKLNGNVVDLLYSRKCILVVMAYEARTKLRSWVDYTKEQDQEAILAAVKRINEYDATLIPYIRYAMLKCFKNKSSLQQLIDVYGSVFFDEYPLITDDELFEIDSLAVGFALLNKSKITLSDCGYISNFVYHRRKKNECREIIKFLFCDEQGGKYSSVAIGEAFAKNLNYEQIGFSEMSMADKEASVSDISKYRQLTNATEANEFMLQIKCLVPSLEETIINAGRSAEYIELISQIQPPSDFTKNWIINAEINCPLPPHLLTLLLENGKEDKYLVGKVLADGEFEFPFDGVSADTIIGQYRVDSPIWDLIKGNVALINYIIECKCYEDFITPQYPEVLQPLYAGKQTVDFVRFLFSKVSESEKINYLQSMGEILDADSSIEISRFLTSESTVMLLRDDGVFNKVRERLWEETPKGSGYKGAFTRKRNLAMQKRNPA